MKRSLLLLLFPFMVITSCKKVVDTDRPTVEIDLPDQDAVVTTDDGLRLVATLSDNTGLLQYKLTINGIDSLNDIGADSTISLIFIEGIPDENKTYYIDDVIPLDDTTFNGHYQLTLACIDIEGNESFRDTVNFQIRNSIDSQPPVFNVSGPPPGDTLTLGEGFVVGGTVSDSQSLIYSEFYVGRADFSDTISFVRFPWVQNNVVDYDNVFNWWFPVDSTWSQGEYRVYYTAWDNYSGVSHEIPFYVFY